MNKRHKNIVKDVITRWQETIAKTGRGEVDAAKKLLQKIYPTANIAIVDTPAQFYVAQAVIRKRAAKKIARTELCAHLNIAPDFIDDLPLSGGPVELVSGKTWTRRSSNTLLARAWMTHTDMVFNDKVFSPVDPAAARSIVFGPSSWIRNDNTDLQNRMTYQLCDVHGLYHEFTRTIAQPAQSFVHGKLNFTSRMMENVCLSLHNAISGSPADIISGHYNFRQHAFDATQCEIMCRLMNCKRPEVTFFHEIFHMVPAIMRMRDTFLILAEKPKIEVNSAGQLHSDTGPAVNYVDGHKVWFIDGHILRDQGEKIVTAPDKLSGKEIMTIANEEERRVAIDRMGWEKYLVEINAKVIDTRENWVDNTIEVLFKVPTYRRRHGPAANLEFDEIPALRVMLSCRSTGRRYFLAVPEKTEQEYWRRNKARNIKTCADVQKWMSDGAKSEYLPYAKYDLNVVGAS